MDDQVPSSRCSSPLIVEVSCWALAVVRRRIVANCSNVSADKLEQIQLASTDQNPMTLINIGAKLEKLLWLHSKKLSRVNQN